jgi:hypothetical protein
MTEEAAHRRPGSQVREASGVALWILKQYKEVLLTS